MHNGTKSKRRLWPALSIMMAVSGSIASTGQALWGDLGGNAQHTSLSTVASQSLDQILWQTAVDLNPQFSGNDLLVHYGTPVITQDNTVIVPVKTGATDGFMLEAINGSTGAIKWTSPTDYSLPYHNWTPSYGPTIAPSGRVYYAGAGGTVYYRDNVDSVIPSTAVQVAFYGNSTYQANKDAFNANVQVCTPLTTDAAGNVYFGYRVSGSTPDGLSSGIARIGADGTVTYMSAYAASGGAAFQVPINCAPAVSKDGKTVYVVMMDGYQNGYMVALNSTSLATVAMAPCVDPQTGYRSLVVDDSSASPMIAPDGSVYYGVLESPFNSSKGWMLHFSADLATTYTPGAFGWDDTASIVPSSMVPSYTGTSSYLIFTKYNDYYDSGGSGINKIAILDPNATEIDPRTGTAVMREVMSIAGPTPDPQFPGTPAVKEWCINSAAVDPQTDSILANSEDGNLYRWDLATNSFTQQITLTPGVGEAYTPTVIGADGTVYAINDATLFAVGNASILSTPEPSAVVWTVSLSLVLSTYFLRHRRAKRGNMFHGIKLG